MKRMFLVGAAIVVGFTSVLFAGAAKAAGCDPADIVVNGASLGDLSADGRPLLTIEGVGDVTIRRHGRTVRLIEECDPVAAAIIRRDLTAKLNGSEGGNRYEIPAERYEIPAWLMR